MRSLEAVRMDDEINHRHNDTFMQQYMISFILHITIHDDISCKSVDMNFKEDFRLIAVFDAIIIIIIENWAIPSNFLPSQLYS